MNICIITLNPGIDRILYLNSPTAIGSLNRADHSIVSQGSKGANLSILLKTLGGDPHHFTFSGGAFGKLYESFCREAGVKNHIFETAAGVRMNTKVIDNKGNYTEFNERGGPVTKDELDGFFSMVFDKNFAKFDLAVLTGSFPQGVENSVYNSLIKKFNSIGTPVILDADGEGMRLGLEARPALIKPNRRELGGIVGLSEEELLNDEAVISACREVREKYGCDVICTLDADGALYYGEGGEAIRVPAARVEARGFTGAGDSFLAGFIFKRFIEGGSVKEAMVFATAAAAAKVKKEGTELPTKKEVFQTLDEIRL